MTLPVGLVAVTGATGAVGGRVAAGLAERGLEQRLLVRDPARAPRLADAQVREIGGYADGERLRAALTGADTLFLVPAHEAPDRVDQHRNVIDAAVDAGVGRIVYLSFLGARAEATFTLARDHWETEEHIRRAGLAWTFLRMSLYADLLPGMAGTDGVIRGPAGAGQFAPVTRDDVAAAVVAVLTGGTHDGSSYDLTGGQRLTMAEVAATIGEVTGRTTRFVDETEAEAYASRAPYRAPQWEVRGWVSSYLAIRDGSLDVVSDDLPGLIGRAPVTLAEYLATAG